MAAYSPSPQALQRFVILLPGIIIAYFSVRDILPFFDQKVPVVLAVFITYIIAAYVLIPALFRAFRIIVPARHLPLYCITPDGLASDPINIGIIASRRQLIGAMEKIGWFVADRHTLHTSFKRILCTLGGRAYPNAPMSNLYLFGRRQDIGFELPLGSRFGQRHHVRFWATTFTGQNPLNARAIHWQERREHFKANDDLLWVGAASLDVGLTLIRHNIQLTHMIDPDTDRERDFIVGQMAEADLSGSARYIRLRSPYKLINRGWRAYLKTDGRMAVLSLRTKQS